MNLMTIGQIAQQTGIAVPTIRFYEKQGLIPPPRRSPSGYRQFDPDAIRRLRFIRKAKKLGFSLDDINGLMSLQRVPTASAADVRDRVLGKIAEITQKIEELGRMRDALTHLAESCDGEADLEDCPILDSLNRP